MNDDLYPKFRNKDGSLTAYAFICGYVQGFDFGEYSLKLRHCMGSYDVEAFDAYKSFYYECFDKLTDARKAYRVQKKLIKQQTWTT